MASVVRTLVVTAVLAGGVLLGYWRLTLDQQAKAIAELQALNAQMQQQVAAREAMIERLSRSRRIAHIKVLDQQKDQRGEVTTTTVEFIELSDRGSELARRTYALAGRVMFVDAWVIKFDPERVADGDPMRGRSLVLLRRMYSDRIAPQDGQAIDTPGAIPPGYAASDIGEFEKQLWHNFWDLATDAEKARAAGVRVAQGEAVYKPIAPGQTFELVVDAVGGMSLSPLPQPADDPVVSQAN